MDYGNSVSMDSFNFRNLKQTKLERTLPNNWIVRQLKNEMEWNVPKKGYTNFRNLKHAKLE